ncbi:MAG: LysR family transcriptional regulator [Proteobacteria bacterium]|jgi:DNA-binding transcriptional LysR family regulator|nr:LysR family transcriptional regulator [Pseudomonadota bacterium]
MRYTLKQLRYIDIAARQQSITGAAKALNISPSSISSAIDAIEAQTNKRIFNRSPSKGIYATQFGHGFLSNARHLLKAHTVFEEAMDEQAKTINGSITLGCFTPAAPILLPMITKSVAENYPGISIHLTEGDTLKNLRHVADNEIDLAIGANLTLDANLSLSMNVAFIPLFNAPPHIVLPHNHALSKRSLLSLKDVCNEPMVLLDLDQTREYMFSLFNNDDLSPKVAYSSQTGEMVRNMVAAGLGYSIFNLRPLQKQQYTVGDLVRIPLKPHYTAVEYGILHRSDVQLSKAAHVVIDTCVRLRDSGAFNQATLPEGTQG